MHAARDESLRTSRALPSLPASVTSAKGLQSWKHRFAVNRALSWGFVGPAGPHPLRFGGIGLHGVRIGIISEPGREVKSNSSFDLSTGEPSGCEVVPLELFTICPFEQSALARVGRFFVSGQ
jgi:hypothetical protein